MEGCRTEEDIKNSMRSYFKKQREKQQARKQTQQPFQQQHPQPFQQQQSQPFQQQQSQPVQQQPVIIQQPQQSTQPRPIIVQQPQQAQQYIQQPIQQPQQYIQQPQQQTTYQTPKHSLLSNILYMIILIAVLMTSLWIYQGGAELAVTNWTEIFHIFKTFIHSIGI